MSAPRPPARLDLGQVAALLDRLEVGPDKRFGVPDCPARMGADRAMTALAGPDPTTVGAR